MQRPARFSLLAYVLVALAPLGFGCKGECRVGESQCVSSALIRTCIPGDGDNEWLVYQCGPTERCEDRRGATTADDAGASSADGGREDAAPPDASTARPELIGAACVGRCEIGEHACVSSALARHCASGGTWELEPCDVGERCDPAKGLCVVGDGPDTVRRCEPGKKACANERVEKVCDEDGTAWIELPCAANEVCLVAACGPDPESSCDDANSCIDNKTAVRCLGGSQGFELMTCEGDQYCETGRCRGSVCAIGSICSGSNQIRECVDGESYRDIQCGVNEVCQQVKDRAKCAPRQCEAGKSACGDPRDSSVDAKMFFTTCVVASSGSGVPEWVRGECSGNATCDPALVATPNPCSQTCTSGHQRCASDPVTGINDGFQECGDDGSWGPVQSCNTGNQSEKQCVQAPNPDASVLPKALCAAPICWWTFGNPMAGAEGACEQDKLRACRPDGTLGDPESCELGVCSTVNTITTADGHTPAACQGTQECEPDEQLCLHAGSATTPRFRSCKDGVFSAEIETCADDGDCYNTRDSAGKRRVVCGAECAPGSGRCNEEGELERCGSNGRWGSGQACEIGSCRTLGSNDASCVLSCVPGSVSCTGEAKTASDGYHSGFAEQRICNDDGEWDAPTECEADEACRVSASGLPLGCIACIGPMVPGGNSEGTVDSRCEPSDDSKIQDCDDGNVWKTSRTCAGGRRCVGAEVQTCGSCNGTLSTFQCTDSNLRNEQICAACNVPLTGGGTTMIEACTEGAIMGTSDAATSTCSGVSSGGAPGSWAGHADCCSGYQRTAFQLSGASCASLGYGAPSAWGGVADCCGMYRVGTDGASFAYCE